MKNSTEKIAIVLLAAGASTRLGQPKQLLKFGEKTLLEKITEVALSTGCQPVVIVLGAFFEKIQSEVVHMPVTILNNENWASGMGGTIACSMDFLMKNHPETEAVLLILCDQPHLSPEVLEKLVEEWRASGKSIVASEYGGTFGVPALFDKKLFPELAALDGEKGAKPVMLRHREEMEFVPFPEGKTDLDTPEDYTRFARH